MKKDIKFMIFLLLGILLMVSISVYQLSIVKPELSRLENIGFWVVAGVVMLFVFIASFAIYRQKNLTEEKAFLITIPFICLLFIILMPTFKNHDETGHWNRIYEISTGNLLTKKINGRIGNFFPRSTLEVYNNQDWEGITYSKLLELSEIRLKNQENTVFIPMGTTAIYSPIQYLPQVLGVCLSRLMTDHVLVMAYMARIFNLIVSLALLYYAIKWMPFGKKIVLVLAYIPILIEGISSMSPDALTISVAYLLIAYILNLTYSKKVTNITNKNLIFIGILASVLALCKIVYIPLVFFILILPKEKFALEKNRRISLAMIIIIAVLINLTWLGISSHYLADYQNDMPLIQTVELITHPFIYIKKLFYTIGVEGQSYLAEIFGSTIGWCEFIKVSDIIPMGLGFLFMLICFLDNSIKEILTKQQKILIAIISVTIILLIFTSLYIQWTKYGSPIIEGVQGRYFLPIMPFIGLLLGSVKIKTVMKEQNLTKIIAVTGILLEINCILTIYLHQI